MATLATVLTQLFIAGARRRKYHDLRDYTSASGKALKHQSSYPEMLSVIGSVQYALTERDTGQSAEVE